MKTTLSLHMRARSLTLSRCADYWQMTRPRLTALVLFTVAAGFCLASVGIPDLGLLLHTILGTGLVIAGASVLNQVLERHSDALMQRTADRPVPCGRIQSVEASVVGLGLGFVGIAYLVITVRQPWTPLAAGFAFSIYVWVYTPLKQKTALNTLAGAVAGALPVWIGWTAATNGLQPTAWFLFAIVFLWQVPHFLAIAWIYRDDYARAGLCMLPVLDRSGQRTGWCMIGYCLALLLVSLGLGALGWAGPLYLAGAVTLGLVFLARTVEFWYARSLAQARRVLRISLVYLPALFTLLLVDKVFQVWMTHR